MDLEAQKILDQKYHSTLENNSLKGGDIGQKMSKSLAKIFEISKFQFFIDFSIEKKSGGNLEKNKKFRCFFKYFFEKKSMEK